MLRLSELHPNLDVNNWVASELNRFHKREATGLSCSQMPLRSVDRELEVKEPNAACVPAEVQKSRPAELAASIGRDPPSRNFPIIVWLISRLDLGFDMAFYQARPWKTLAAIHIRRYPFVIAALILSDSIAIPGDPAPGLARLGLIAGTDFAFSINYGLLFGGAAHFVGTSRDPANDHPGLRTRPGPPASPGRAHHAAEALRGGSGHSGRRADLLEPDGDRRLPPFREAWRLSSEPSARPIPTS